MSNSLEGCIVNETYDRIIHTGSSMITGNPGYTGTGTCLPYCFNQTSFDVQEAGVIRRDLTINTMLTGQVFGPTSNSVADQDNNCVFGKCNTITGGSDTYIIGGQYNLVTSGVRPILVNSFHLSVLGGFFATGINTMSSCICTVNTNAGTLIGGVCNYSDSQYSLMVSGSCNKTCSSYSSVLVSGAFNVISGGGSPSIFGGLYNRMCNACCSTITTGCFNAISSASNSNIFTGRHNEVVNDSGCNTCTSRAVIGTGVYNCIHSDIVTTSDFLNDPEIFTGCCNTITKNPSQLMFAPRIFTGTDNFLSGYFGGNIYNGSNNRVTHEGVLTFLNGKDNCGNGGCVCNRYYMLNGELNCLSSGAVNSGTQYIYNGQCNVSDGGTSTGVKEIHSGRSNAVSTCNAIYSGECNTSRSPYGNCIYSGCNNCMSEIFACRSIIYGGSDNQVQCMAYGTITGGKSNFIQGTCVSNLFTNWGSNIIGGECNVVCSKCQERTVFGGCCNRICVDNTSVGSAIMGGRNNVNTHTGAYIAGSSLSSAQADATILNNLIIDDLPVSDGTGLAQYTWYRCPGEDIIRVIP